MSDNETYKQLFCGEWEWSSEEGIDDFFKAVGMPDWVIDYEKISKPSMKITLEDDGYISCVLKLKTSGDKNVVIEDKMKLGDTKTIKNDKEEPKLINTYTMTLDGKKLNEVTVPELPPGKTYNMITERVGDELHTCYIVKNDAGQSVTAKRVFTLKK